MLPEEAIPASVTSRGIRWSWTSLPSFPLLFPCISTMMGWTCLTMRVSPLLLPSYCWTLPFPGLGSVLPLVLVTPMGTGTPPASVSSFPIGVTFFLLVQRVSPCLGRLIMWQIVSCAACSGPHPRFGALGLAGFRQRRGFCWFLSFGTP